MMDYLHNVGYTIYDGMFRLDREQWILVFVGALILGFMCLRGFGSRTNY